MTTEIKNNKIFAPLKKKWFVLTPEEKVRQEYIVRLVKHYGYELEQMAQEVQVNNAQRGQGRARADIVIWKSKKEKIESKSPLIVIECKAENITVREEDYYQGYNYAAWAGAKFFVTTNLKETRIFQVISGMMPKRLNEIIDIPKAKDINNEKKVAELLKQTKAFTRDEFSKLLFKCHNIIRNNDKLSPEAAFDEISKILFIKIRYERTNDEAQIFSKEQFLKDKAGWDRHSSKDSRPFYQQLFENTKEDFKEDDLFAENEKIRIRQNSFEAIVEELQKYNLSTTSDDVKGIAFEKFLGRTFRGELGQFFTPRPVVDFMVDILDPQEGEVICDPACGSGGFLIKAFEYVRENIEKEIQVAKEKVKKDFYTDKYETLSEKEKKKIDKEVNELFNTLNNELNIQHPESRIRKLSYDCIYGTDANPRMARTAKMNMIMHGDGHGGVHHNDGLLNVNGIFENRFDIILTNPPFGSRVEKSLKITEADIYRDEENIKKYRKRFGDVYDLAMQQIENNLDKPILSLYEIGSTLTEVLFMERCLNLLKPGGRMGIVLPEGVLNNTNLQKVRDFFESRAKILLITSIPQDVFIASGATVKPSLLFFKKFTDKEKELWEKLENEATEEISLKYADKIDPIKEKLSLKGKEAPNKEEKKKLRAELKLLEKQIEYEIRKVIKNEFDYEIPIAEVEKAGITSTAAVTDNELIPLAKEFKKYRKKNKLWKNKYKGVTYSFNENELVRMTAAETKVLYSYDAKK
ncbi:MAG: N-6 DNA methylase [Ignavibacteriae bacterium]|nr:N-6 DNA methylase [Ignavibacteriota bacterium]